MVQCDVCENAAGSIYCFADAAVMCPECDKTVHNANKLAAKHDRVELSKAAESATCDICQDRPAVLFCSEDRALICRRCDIMIHTANEFTTQHHRYLLSGTTLGLHPMAGGETGTSPGRETSADKSKRSAAEDSKASTGLVLSLEPVSISTRSSTMGAEAGPSSRSMLTRAAPRSMSSGALVEVPATASALGGGDTWISSSGMEGTGKAPMSLQQQQQEQLRSDQMNAACNQASRFGGFPDVLSGGDFGDFFDQQPSSSSISVGRDGSFTLAHELLGLPTMSQAFSAKDIDAAYLFEDMGDLDDDLSSLLVPDLDFSSIVANPMPAVPKMPQPVQTGGFGDRFGNSANSPSSASQDGVVPDISAPTTKRQRA